jgi:hypothetical protein
MIIQFYTPMAYCIKLVKNVCRTANADGQRSDFLLPALKKHCISKPETKARILILRIRIPKPEIVNRKCLLPARLALPSASNLRRTSPAPPPSAVKTIIPQGFRNFAFCILIFAILVLLCFFVANPRFHFTSNIRYGIIPT